MPTTMMFIYLITGSIFAVFVITWALRTRQFDDQERARFLALRDLSPDELSNPPPRRITPSVAFMFVAVLVAVIAFARLFYTLATVG